MTVLFWVLAAGLVVVALAILFFGVRHADRGETVDRDLQNAEIAREKLERLKNDLAAGTLSEEEYSQLRNELEQELGTDLAGPRENVAPGGGRPWGIVIVTVIVVPALAFSLYAWLGNPAMVTPVTSDTTSLSLEQVASRLEAEVRQDPKDAEAWFMLGHVYMQQDRYADAAHAFGQAEGFVPENADVLLSHADALAMTQGGRLAGKPEQLIARALQVSPNNTTALWLAGMASNQRGDYEQAVKHWRRVEQMVRKDPKTLKQVRSLIAQAEKKLGHHVAAEAPVAVKGKTLKVVVRIASSLAKDIGPGDTVFVFARAEKGPAMPLAVVRKPARDLPFSVTLDDSMAMVPAMRLSAFGRVMVGARISKSGNAMPQPGDLESTLIRAVPGQQGQIALEINKKVSG